MPETDFTFTATADAAFLATVNRNVAGAKLSRRLWGLSQNHIRDINTVVSEFVRNGRSMTAAGKEIMRLDPKINWRQTPAGKMIPELSAGAEGVLKVRIPKYIQELKTAAETARSLSDSSVLQKEIRKYQSYMAKLMPPQALDLDVARRYQHLGIGGATRQFSKRLQSKNQEVYEKAVDKWVARKASYQARMVARNETNEAHWNALLNEGVDKPYIKGYQWMLGRHPKPDICDTLVGKIFTKEQLDAKMAEWGGNRRPHPMCNCWLKSVMDKDFFDNYTPSAELLQQVQSDPRFPEFKSWATGWLEKIGMPYVIPAVPVAIAPVTVLAEWKPAETIEQAEQFIKDQDLANNFLYSGGRQWGGRLSQKAALEKFNIINEEINDFQERFGIKLPKVHDFYITNDTRGHAASSIGGIGGFKISFGQEWDERVWFNIETWERKSNKKWDWSKEESHIKYNVRHEYAHILDGKFGITKSDEFFKLRDGLGRKGFAGPQISEYAIKNSREWWAESFAQYTSPLYEKYKKFPSELEKFFDDILGRIKK